MVTAQTDRTVIVDWDADGRKDLLYPVLGVNGAARWWWIRSTGTGLAPAVDTGYGVDSIGLRAVAVDVNGDGRDDLVYAVNSPARVMARLHDGEGLPVAGTGPDDGQKLALAVQAAVQRHTGARDRGIKNREDLAMTSRIVCPAVLIECGFLSSAPESRKIGEAGYRKKLVRGIADGYEEGLVGRSGVPTGAGVPLSAPSAGEAAGDAEH